MKKEILLLAGIFSFSSVMALEGEELTKYTENKLSKYNIEDVYEGRSNLQRTYLGEHWTVLELQEGYKTYALLNPVTDRIKKIRIVSEYCESCLGKEMKMLEDIYETKGRISEANVFNINTGSIDVKIYADFDYIDGNPNDLFSIIDFSGKEKSTLRQQSIDNIYYQKEMNRK